MNELMDVYLEGSTCNPVKMTEIKYIHPSLNEGEYIRLFADSEMGLVFNNDYLLGLWLVAKETSRKGEE